MKPTNKLPALRYKRSKSKTTRSKMEQPDVISKVPDHLKKIVRLTARAFYQPLQIVCLDILTKYPCVALTDLVEVLKMHGSQKLLQQALNKLQKEKMLKWVQRMEVPPDFNPEDGRKPNPRLVHYYYINYKEFVNVVKCKLHMMRKKLESDDKMSQNRTSYMCPNCKKTFTDLDVNKLIDLADGTLKCSHCRTVLEEEEQQKSTVDSRTLISQLNDYVKPITDLLRGTEDLNLAPEILDPEPQSIAKYLLSSGIGRKTTSPREQSWATHSTRDIYGEKTDISINFGDDSQDASKTGVKERPEWLEKSTVYQQPEGAAPVMEDEAEATKPVRLKRSKDVSDTERQILEDLMTHEKKSLESAGPSSSYLKEQVAPQYSSSSSGDEEMEVEPGGGAPSVSWMGGGARGGGGFDDVEEFEDESSEDGDDTVMVGGRPVAIDEVTTEMVTQMTAEEKARYTKAVQRAFENDDDFS